MTFYKRMKKVGGEDNRKAYEPGYTMGIIDARHYCLQIAAEADREIKRLREAIDQIEFLADNEKVKRVAQYALKGDER